MIGRRQLMAGAAGGIPGRRPDQYQRPRGGLLPAPQNNIVIGRFVIVAGNKGGLFVYSGPPAAGNLVASITAQAGTDPFGNAYQAGITSYSPSALNPQYSQLDTGLLAFQPGGAFAPNVARIATIGGSQRLQINGPYANNTVSMDFLGDAFTPNGMIVIGQGVASLTPQTAAMLEVQGSIAVSALSALTSGSVANSAAETQIGSYTIAANDAAVGSGYRFRMAGAISTDVAGPTLRIRIRLGSIAGAVIADFGLITCQPSLASVLHVIDSWLYFTGLGGAGHLDIFAEWGQAASAAGLTAGQMASPAIPGGRRAVLVDTTAPVNLVITAQFGTASAANACSTEFGSLERIIH